MNTNDLPDDIKKITEKVSQRNIDETLESTEDTINDSEVESSSVDGINKNQKEEKNNKALGLVLKFAKANKFITILVILITFIFIQSLFKNTDEVPKATESVTEILETNVLLEEDIFENMGVESIVEKIPEPVGDVILPPVTVSPEDILSELISDDIESDFTGEINSENIEKIAALELEVNSIKNNLESITEYATSEIQRLLKNESESIAKIDNLQKQVRKKKYDLGYEKDRPQLNLNATVPAPEECNSCVSHASFVYEDIQYQAGNGGVWHGFNIEVSGNRMTLKKNEYVYDYWVSQ